MSVFNANGHQPPPWTPAGRGRAQSGNALVEFIIGAMLFLVPLYLAVQALGKFADVRHMAQAAARYAAWERIVWHDTSGLDATSADFYQKNLGSGQQVPQKSDAQIRSEIAVRLFNDRNSALAYNDSDKGATSPSLANGLDPLWEDSAGAPYLTNYDAATTLTGTVSQPSKDLVGGALSGISDAARSLGVLKVTGSLVPPLPSQTLTQATFELRGVASASDVYKRLWNSSSGLPDWAGFSTSAQAAVLANAWNANGSGGTLAMVKESVPTAQDAVKLLLQPVVQNINAWEPLVGNRLDVGKIAVDVVPGDRLR